jgi:amino acid adenylation domain-containing protein
LNARDLLDQLEALGVALAADGDRLRVRAAPGQLSDELKAGIAQHKSELLVLLSARGMPVAAAAPEGEYPVSFGQRRLWFLDRLEPGNSAYHLGAAHRIDAAVDVAVMEAAINDVVERQASLRTVFREVDGEPLQVVLPFAPQPLRVVDLSQLPPAERQAAAERATREEAMRLFDLAEGPLFRAVLLRLGAQQHQLLFTLHHIVCDGWSLGIFLSDLNATYAARHSGSPAALAPLTLHFGRHAAREREHLSGAALDRLLAYWRGKLGGAAPTLDLPTDRPRPRQRSFGGAGVSFSLSPALSDALRNFARSERATLYMVLLALFKVLLSRLSGQNDIVVGTPVANRPTPELEALIGMFVSTLPIRTELAPEQGMRALLAQVRDDVIDAQAHGELPFEKMVDELRIERSLAWSPIFQVVFALQNTPLASAFEVTTVAAMYDLSLYTWDEPAGVRGVFEYNTTLFDATTIERMRDHFVCLAESAVADPARAIAKLPMLTPPQRAQVLVDWNDTSRPYPRDSSLHALFDAVARRSPQAVAVVSAEPAREVLPVSTLSYAELADASDRLAARLRGHGVQPGTAVGLYLERSVGAVVAMLAILKAGAAYLPLETGDPQSRTNEILRDAGVRFVLTQRSLASRLAGGDLLALALEDEWLAEPVPPAPPADAASTANPAEALAYVMFTSGTTGVPKGVCVSHRNVARLVCNPDYIALGPDEAVLQLAPLAFDASTLEIWGALLNGGRLVVLPRNVPTATELAQVLREHAVSTLWLTAGFFHSLVEADVQALAAVRQVLAGGDVLSVSHVQHLLDAKRDGVVVNGYGPTENTTFTCCHRMLPGLKLAETVPIGRPIANTRVYLLDAQGEPVPPGVAGELFTGGDGVARGYLANATATAEKFLPDPFDDRPGATMYRTGDLARWRADGTIEFLGRRDRQVKVRGFRIELEEVEDALRACAGVRDAAVVVRRDAGGSNALVAYVVPREAQAIDVAALKQQLGATLPAYMVPAAFVGLAELPLTANGKLDRAALPEPAAEAAERRIVEPRTMVETQLQAIWETVLGRTGFGVTDNFFDLGGHSLIAVRLFAQIEKVFHVKLPVSALFAAPDIAQLAQRPELKGYVSPWSSLVTIRAEGRRPPLFMVPGVGGNVLCFSDLARCLGPDQPIYGLQSRGLDERDLPFERIEPMATHYLGEIRKVQPQGPYRIGGTCFGGAVAYEMAQQLRRSGEQVEVLFMLETWPAPKSRRWLDRLRTYSHEIFFLWSAAARNLGKIARMPMRERLGALWNAMKIVGEIAAQGDVYRGDRAAMYVDRVSLANLHALGRYEPRPYDGRLRFAVAAERAFTGEDGRKLWRQLAPADYAQAEFAVNDSGKMLMNAHVDALARWMRDALDALDATPSPTDGAPAKDEAPAPPRTHAVGALPAVELALAIAVEGVVAVLPSHPTTAPLQSTALLWVAPALPGAAR